MNTHNDRSTLGPLGRSVTLHPRECNDFAPSALPSALARLKYPRPALQRDRYGRMVAICRASGEDLGAIMVREGFAWAFTRYSVDYVDQQEEARRANRGVHAHDCVPAWEWRAQQRR